MRYSQTTHFDFSSALQDLQSSEIETNYDAVYESFDDMNLKEPLLRGIYAYGYIHIN